VHSPKSKCLYIIIGWLISRIVLSLFRGITIGPIFLLPGFFILLIFLFLFWKLVYTETSPSYITFVILGIVADSFLYWIVREGTGAPLDIENPWDIRLVYGSIISVSVVLVGLLLSSRFCFKTIDRISESNRKYFWIIPIVAVITTAIFRISFLTMQDLPNEERSLIIAGFEIHHAFIGIAILVFLSIFIASRCIRNVLMIAFIYGVSAGFILDQCSYLSLAEVSDVAYNDSISWIGAIAGNVVLFICLYIQKGRCAIVKK